MQDYMVHSNSVKVTESHLSMQGHVHIPHGISVEQFDSTMLCAETQQPTGRVHSPVSPLNSSVMLGSLFNISFLSFLICKAAATSTGL
jgi:hypothetical protein